MVVCFVLCVSWFMIMVYGNIGVLFFFGGEDCFYRICSSSWHSLCIIIITRYLMSPFFIFQMAIFRKNTKVRSPCMPNGFINVSNFFIFIFLV